MTVTKQTTSREYAGLVWNNRKQQSEILFHTECSALLARNRAIEKARERNEWAREDAAKQAKGEIDDTPVYDLDRVSIKSREVVTSYGEWQDEP